MEGFDAENLQDREIDNLNGVDDLRTEYFNSYDVPGLSGLSKAKTVPSGSTTSSGVLNSEAMEYSKILEMEVIKLDLCCEPTTDLILVQDHAFLQDVMALGMGVVGIGVLAFCFIFSEK